MAIHGNSRPITAIPATANAIRAIFDGRTAREHLIEADLSRLVDVDPGWRGGLGLSGTSRH
jgi:hypothetical protein